MFNSSKCINTPHFLLSQAHLSCSSTFQCDTSRKTGTVQSMLICCPALSGDVTNIPIGGRKQQFPLNWKAPRPFGHCCYLAAALPSWPSMRDAPLNISFLPPWIEPQLHHHSNRCLASTPRDIVISQMRRDCVSHGEVWGFFGACVCVCVDMFPCSCWCHFHFYVWIIDQASQGIYYKARRV